MTAVGTSPGLYSMVTFILVFQITFFSFRGCGKMNYGIYVEYVNISTSTCQYQCLGLIHYSAFSAAKAM